MSSNLGKAKATKKNDRRTIQKADAEGKKEALTKIIMIAVRDYNKPMGVATYKSFSDMPKEMQKTLPDIEELKKLMDDDDVWNISSRLVNNESMSMVWTDMTKYGDIMPFGKAQTNGSLIVPLEMAAKSQYNLF